MKRNAVGRRPEELVRRTGEVREALSGELVAELDELRVMADEVFET